MRLQGLVKDDPFNAHDIASVDNGDGTYSLSVSSKGTSDAKEKTITLDTDYLSIPSADTGSIGIDVSGTFSGTLSFSVQTDDSETGGRTAYVYDDNGIGVQTVTAPGHFVFPSAGSRVFTVNVDTLVSGTPLVKLTQSYATYVHPIGTSGEPAANVSVTSSALPTGASSATNQTSQQANPGSDATKAVAVQGVTNGKAVKISIDQTTPGTTNKVSIGTDGSVGITGTVPLPTNAATDTLQTAGNASAATTATATGNLALATGTVIAGTAGTKSVLGGGIYNSTPLTLTNGQQAALQFDATGKLKVSADITSGADASAANQTAVQAVAGSSASKANAVQGISGGLPVRVQGPLNLEGNAQVNFAVSDVAAQSVAVVPAGTYKVWCNISVYIKVHATADNVTTATGYRLLADNTEELIFSGTTKLGAIAETTGMTGTIRFHKV